MTKTRTWIAPAGLIAFGFVPMLAGVIRLTELAGGPEVTPDNARFLAAPAAVVVHIVAVFVYSLFGALQFAHGLRRRRPGWHRAAGRVLVGCGLAAALSGVWMTLFQDRPPGDGDLLAGFRVLFGSGMAVCLVLGLAAIRRRDVRRHRAWMTRAYAIALGAATQALALGAWIGATGQEPGETARALLLGGSWVVNVAVAEWIIRRGSAPHAVGLVRPHGDLDPVAYPELGHQAGDVTLDRTE
jgi:uncharacterized membrane protein